MQDPAAIINHDKTVDTNDLLNQAQPYLTSQDSISKLSELSTGSPTGARRSQSLIATALLRLRREEKIRTQIIADRIVEIGSMCQPMAHLLTHSKIGTLLPRNMPPRHPMALYQEMNVVYSLRSLETIEEADLKSTTS
ncbi:MAG: hypothetical protein J3Q66DRAFT_399362 [Benniella sp.]|nr:MAG: hypothetical protein J3Q66DRAFT_399362 [Benniella sp.]